MTFNPDNPREHEEHQEDPYAVAGEAAIAPRSYYGQIDVDCWFCALVKGQGKVPYDPSEHDRRSTCIDMQVVPLADMNISYELSRSMLDWERAWAGVTWPSLKECGATSVREAKDKWCKFQWISTGRKYRNSDGDERESTTFKFLAIYDDEDACRAAYYADTGKDPTQDPNAVEPIPGMEPRGPNGNGGNANAAQVTPFIIAFAKTVNYDIEKTRELCAGQPMITRVIDVNSSEFNMIVAEAIAAK